MTDQPSGALHATVQLVAAHDSGGSAAAQLDEKHTGCTVPRLEFAHAHHLGCAANPDRCADAISQLGGKIDVLPIVAEVDCAQLAAVFRTKLYRARQCKSDAPDLIFAAEILHQPKE